MNGVQSIYWVYPAIVIVFYLIRPRAAIIVCAICIAGLVPAISPVLPGFELATVLITLVVSGAFAYAFSTVSRSQRARLHLLATKDPLTNAGNRRALNEKIETIVSARDRANNPASMLLLDLDHFKQVNDDFGHAVGDRILIRLAEIINLRIRVTDSLYRIGGEEFVVVVDGQDLDKAGHLAEQLRTLVEANELAPNRVVTISIGVAELQLNEAGVDWLRRADDALYNAKRGGRNTTRLAQ
jgi:diguanylate cyclase (GGDEF)-like protein